LAAAGGLAQKVPSAQKVLRLHKKSIRVLGYYDTEGVGGRDSIYFPRNPQMLSVSIKDTLCPCRSFGIYPFLPSTRMQQLQSTLVEPSG
jgi:hypothetical protein